MRGERWEVTAEVQQSRDLGEGDRGRGAWSAGRGGAGRGASQGGVRMGWKGGQPSEFAYQKGMNGPRTDEFMRMNLSYFLTSACLLALRTSPVGGLSRGEVVSVDRRLGRSIERATIEANRRSWDGQLSKW